jgi:mannose-6-phosphate isomerase
MDQAATFEVLRGVPQHYDWGSPTAIPELLAIAPDGRPWAELWFGTHHGGAASILHDGRWAPLAEVAGDLPYLTKLLAAERPLSLQAHPSAAQAAEGFAREEAGGVALGDPVRVYCDRRPKPEVLIALSPFDALCGFRPVDETADLLTSAGPVAASLGDRLRGEGIARLVTEAMTRSPDRQLLAECVASPAYGHLSPLVQRYPDDPALTVALLLHHVVLEPGEAIYLPAGNLHAYLSGLGLEVMGSSDNVVRGGFTRKHVDVVELLRVLDATPIESPVVRADLDGAYATPGAPFRVTRRRDASREDRPLEVTFAAPDRMRVVVQRGDFLVTAA